jgi:hypothetical protein
MKVQIRTNGESQIRAVCIVPDPRGLIEDNSETGVDRTVTATMRTMTPGLRRQRQKTARIMASELKGNDYLSSKVIVIYLPG